ncbi:MAG TPA: guanylate kinase [Bacillota bacterium]|jgi:guanylate kinase|nr:guanylate kinase [Bacillota bacterium]HOL10466.1 guanylate kinase [Bacillota bacterium]HPO98167.1 guanylate kinase [Bacillota bacterium]
MQQGLLIVISGPSGVGKNTIISNLLDKLPNLRYSISATTRNPRPHEVDGQHYYFISEELFLKKIEAMEFLEWAKVYKDYYGTPKDQILKLLEQGIDVILDVDVQGALQIKKAYPEALLIFLAPPSIAELKNRLINRHTEDSSQIETRLRYIETEFQNVPSYDYFVINQEINLTCSKIEGIILAEKCRVSRQEANFLNKIFGNDNNS